MSLIKKNNSSWGLNPLFSDFFGSDDFIFAPLKKSEWVPSVNVSEDDKKFEIEFAAPGMRKNDFKISIDNGVLTVSAERKEEKEEKKKNYTRQEYRYESFNRSFNLPENAKEDDIKAHYEDGMLKLDIAKKAVTVSKAKEIAVA